MSTLLQRSVTKIDKNFYNSTPAKLQVQSNTRGAHCAPRSIDIIHYKKEAGNALRQKLCAALAWPRRGHKNGSSRPPVPWPMELHSTVLYSPLLLQPSGWQPHQERYEGKIVGTTGENVAPENCGSPRMNQAPGRVVENGR